MKCLFWESIEWEAMIKAIFARENELMKFQTRIQKRMRTNKMMKRVAMINLKASIEWQKLIFKQDKISIISLILKLQCSSCKDRTTIGKAQILTICIKAVCHLSLRLESKNRWFLSIMATMWTSLKALLYCLKLMFVINKLIQMFVTIWNHLESLRKMKTFKFSLQIPWKELNTIIIVNNSMNYREWHQVDLTSVDYNNIATLVWQFLPISTRF